MEPAQDAPIDLLQNRYRKALLHGQSREADAVLDEGLDRGIHVVTLYQDVLGPALERIGELWQQGEMSVADEHLATQIALGQMDRLRREVRPHAARDVRAVVSAVEGNQHTIGARMVADVLAFDGWDVDFLGASLPTSDLVTFVQRRRPQLVALAITLDAHLDTAIDAIAALNTLDPKPGVLVGGAAVNGSLGDLKAAGADGFATDSLSALHEARRLVGLVAESPSLEQCLHQLGQRIKSLRTAREWSQQALADASGLDRTYISAVEHGKQNLTIGAMLKLAEALDVELPELLSQDGLDRLVTDAHLSS